LCRVRRGSANIMPGWSAASMIPTRHQRLAPIGLSAGRARKENRVAGDR
jgi:hypothetical protein